MVVNDRSIAPRKAAGTFTAVVVAVQASVRLVVTLKNADALKLQDEMPVTSRTMDLAADKVANL